MGFLSDVSSKFFGGGETTTNPAKVWEDQSPFLNDLYQRAQLASYGNMGTNYANQINQGAQGAFNNLAGGGQMYNQSGLQNIASGGAQNQYLDKAIQSGLGQLSNNFNRNIMPSINTGAALTNTSGGSRQGIAQGIAASDANQQASDFINSMQSGNYQAGIQNQLGAYGQLSNNAQFQNMAQLGALSQAPDTANLGFGSQYGDLAALSSLIGGPTVLGGGGQSYTGGQMFQPIKLQK